MGEAGLCLLAGAGIGDNRWLMQTQSISRLRVRLRSHGLRPVRPCLRKTSRLDALQAIMKCTSPKRPGLSSADLKNLTTGQRVQPTNGQETARVTWRGIANGGIRPSRPLVSAHATPDIMAPNYKNGFSLPWMELPSGSDRATPRSDSSAGHARVAVFVDAQYTAGFANSCKIGNPTAIRAWCRGNAKSHG